MDCIRARVHAGAITACAVGLEGLKLRGVAIAGNRVSREGERCMMYGVGGIASCISMVWAQRGVAD